MKMMFAIKPIPKLKTRADLLLSPSLWFTYERISL